MRPRRYSTEASEQNGSVEAKDPQTTARGLLVFSRVRVTSQDDKLETEVPETQQVPSPGGEGEPTKLHPVSIRVIQHIQS